VERRELLELVLDLARDAGIEIRNEPGSAGVQSGVCRLRGSVWLVLSATDPLEEHLAVAAAALREHAGPLLEERYLPPAVRELLERP
jgi:hypothetical protein